MWDADGWPGRGLAPSTRGFQRHSFVGRLLPSHRRRVWYSPQIVCLIFWSLGNYSRNARVRGRVWNSHQIRYYCRVLGIDREVGTVHPSDTYITYALHIFGIHISTNLSSWEKNQKNPKKFKMMSNEKNQTFQRCDLLKHPSRLRGETFQNRV